MPTESLGAPGEHTAEPMVAELIHRLSEPDAAEAARAALLARNDAMDGLLFALTDTRETPELRLAAGGVVAEIGDARLGGPERLGPFDEVPAGAFHMGADPADPGADDNAQPQHDVVVPQIAVARYPVTNRAFELFVEELGYRDDALWSPDGAAWRGQTGVEEPLYWNRGPAFANHPVVGVSWFEAMAFAAWATARMRARGDLGRQEVLHLPSEAHWEKAAKGGVFLDDEGGLPNPMPYRQFPWGDGFVPGVANTVESGLGSTSTVGMFPESEGPYKSQDLAGNVAEWCTSKPSSYPYHYTDGREMIQGNARTYRVARGGAWSFNADAARAYTRHWYHADYRGAMLGFRLARSITQP